MTLAPERSAPLDVGTDVGVDAWAGAPLPRPPALLPGPTTAAPDVLAPLHVPSTPGSIVPAARASRRAVRQGVGTQRGDAAALVAGLGAGLAAGVALASGRATLATPGGTATTAGSVAAMVGTYLCLLLLLLAARLPWLEREIGHDRLLGWHRRLAPWAVTLVVAHVVLTAMGYAAASGTGLLPETWALVTTYAWMVPATAALALIVGLALMSVRAVRRRLRHETWWVAHLYFYLAVALAFGHQLEFGSLFADRPVVRWAWTAFYAGVFVVVLLTRVALPLLRSRRHRLRVAAVVPEAPGVVNVILAGRDLAGLGVRGGQYFQWRFLTRHWWWQAHPYSVSMTARDDRLRITVKDLGDQSGSLAAVLRPGTRVVVEGPYGVFTAAARTQEVVTLLAAGVGVTPVRALLDDLPVGCDVTVIYRVAGPADAPLGAELEQLVRAQGWSLWYLPGPRACHPLTAAYLSRFSPRLLEGDVYVCGPAAFTDGVLTAMRSAGVPEQRLHHESFAF